MLLVTDAQRERREIADDADGAPRQWPATTSSESAAARKRLRSTYTARVTSTATTPMIAPSTM